VATAPREQLDRPAFYAMRTGGWRDLVTILHPPYTAWHLSYVALGAVAAPALYAGRLGAALVAFFLAVGVSAHAFDELAGRPLRTALTDRALILLAAAGLVGAVAIGVADPLGRDAPRLGQLGERRQDDVPLAEPLDAVGQRRLVDDPVGQPELILEGGGDRIAGDGCHGGPLCQLPTRLIPQAVAYGIGTLTRWPS